MKLRMSYQLEIEAKEVDLSKFEMVREPFNHLIYCENGLVVEVFPGVEGYTVTTKTTITFESKEELVNYLNKTISKLEKLIKQ